MNRYAYCENDPVNKSYPTARFFLAASTVVGFIISAFTAAALAYDMTRVIGTLLEAIAVDDVPCWPVMDLTDFFEGLRWALALGAIGFVLLGGLGLLVGSAFLAVAGVMGLFFTFVVYYI